jgi:DNA-binding beta-propeller fold protein YncE
LVLTLLTILRIVIVAVLVSLIVPSHIARARSAPGGAGWRVIVGATTPSFAYAMDVAFSPSGNVYVADAWFHEIQQLSAAGAVLHRWTAPAYPHAQLLDRSPSGIGVDGKGNIFIAGGTGSRTVLKLMPNGKRDPGWTPFPFVSSFAGGVEVDGQGNVYVTGDGMLQVVKLSPAGHVLARWGATALGIDQHFVPVDVAIDGQGDIYVADYSGNRVLKLSSSGKLLATWGKYPSGPFSSPTSVATDSHGNVFVLDSYNRGSRIQKFSADGMLLASWSAPSDSRYSSITVSPDGRIYHTEGRIIAVYSPSGALLSEPELGGSLPGQLRAPQGLAVGPSGNLFVADTDNNRIQKFSPTGRLLAVWGSAGAGKGQFHQPEGIAVDRAGDILVADTGNKRLVKLSPAGHVLAQWNSELVVRTTGLPFSSPRGVAVDAGGTIYLADTGLRAVMRLSPRSTRFTLFFDTGPSVAPVSVAVDYSGAVYVGETQQGARSTGAVLVDQLPPGFGGFAGEPANISWMPKYGPSQYSQPGVAVDAYGDVFATDSDSDRQGNRAVWEYTPTGQLLRFLGDRGDRTGHFYYPQGVAIGPTGSIYVADTGNSRIQMLQRQTSPARTPSGTTVLGSTSFHAGIGHGWGTVKPTRIFNGGDPGGIVYGIRWQHWGQTTAIGWGFSFPPRPAGNYYGPARTELRATDISRCSEGGPLAYRRLYFRAPSRPGGPLRPWSNWSVTGNICYS